MRKLSEITDEELLAVNKKAFGDDTSKYFDSLYSLQFQAFDKSRPWLTGHTIVGIYDHLLSLGIDALDLM